MNDEFIFCLVGYLRVTVISYVLILDGLVKVVWSIRSNSLSKSHLCEILGELLLVVKAVQGKLFVALILKMQHQLTIVVMELLFELV